MIRVKQCCCGFSLQAGTQILLWLLLIGEIVSITNNILVVVQYTNMIEGESALTNCTMPWDLINLWAIIYALLGVSNRRPSYLLPVIIMSAVGLFLTALILSFVMCTTSAAREYRTVNDRPYVPISVFFDTYSEIFVILASAYFPLKLYVTIVIYSYYRQLRDMQSGVYSADVRRTSVLNLLFSNPRMTEMAENNRQLAFEVQTVSSPPAINSQPNQISPQKGPANAQWQEQTL